MKTIKRDELFQSLNDFLKVKGIELKEGVYSQRINRACNLLTDAINCTQKTVKHARVKMDKKLEKLRQSIHEATAPKPPPAASKAKKAATGSQGKKTGRTKSRPVSRSGQSSQKK